LLLHAMNPYWLVFGLAVNWIGDTGAYYFGRNFGKHKLAPIVSPGKSWEGAAASVVAAMLFGIFFLARFVHVDLLPAGAIAIAANIAGQVGDLAESAIKRGAGVKDSGTLLPGHGGMLDRVDSSLFSLPVLYALLYITSIK
jgi:phosphatidate cytidylyltransferase